MKYSFDAILYELMRYAFFERKDVDMSDEFGAMVYSLWFLQNPLALSERESVGTVGDYRKNFKCFKNKTKTIPFTAHSHENEPLIPSPDDMLIYSVINRENPRAIHFISDRFDVIKI